MLAHEADRVVVGADHSLAVQAKQRVLQGERLPITDLLLGLLDADEVAAQHLIAGLPGVGFGIAPTTLDLEEVQLVAGTEVVVDYPVADQARGLVVVMDLGIVDVVVVVSQRLAKTPVDQRRAKVLLRVLVAVVVAEGDAQVVAWLPAQRTAEGKALGLATVDPAIAGLLVEVQPIAQGIGERAAAVHGHLPTVIRAVAQAQAVADLAFERLLRHDVDHRPAGTLPVQHRGWAAQDIDALHRPGVDGERDGARAHVQPGAVIQLLGRAMPGETACRQRRAAVAGMTEEGDARGTGYRLLHGGVVALEDLLGADAGHTGGRFQRRQVQA
ncbi:hypothetical protein D3C76_677250 [compost metagenome]